MRIRKVLKAGLPSLSPPPFTIDSSLSMKAFPERRRSQSRISSAFFTLLASISDEYVSAGSATFDASTDGDSGAEDEEEDEEEDGTVSSVALTRGGGPVLVSKTPFWLPEPVSNAPSILRFFMIRKPAITLSSIPKPPELPLKMDRYASFFLFSSVYFSSKCDLIFASFASPRNSSSPCANYRTLR